MTSIFLLESFNPKTIKKIVAIFNMSTQSSLCTLQWECFYNIIFQNYVDS